MRRKIWLLMCFVVIVITGFLCDLIFHEFGHAILATITGLKVEKINIGFENYIVVNFKQATNYQLAWASIGSFILPQIMFLIFLNFKNMYIILFGIISSVGHYVTIVLSMVVLIFGADNFQEWDILLFQKYTDINFFLILSVLAIIMMINLFLEIKSRRFIILIEKLCG